MPSDHGTVQAHAYNNITMASLFGWRLREAVWDEHSVGHWQNGGTRLAWIGLTYFKHILDTILWGTLRYFTLQCAVTLPLYLVMPCLETSVAKLTKHTALSFITLI